MRNNQMRGLVRSAVMTAFLIVVQFAFSVVPGVELVTVLLLTFSYVYGCRWGMMTATAFSLLRCFLFGFSPSVVLLYVIYYNAFAFTFGWVGRKKTIASWICPALLVLLVAFCGYFAIKGIPTSPLYVKKLTAMIWTLFALLVAVLVFYVGLTVYGRKRGERWRELSAIVSLAAFFTVCFTLLDDIITPLFLGYGADAAIAYFYGSFFALLPQTVCTVVTVATLFLPLRKIFKFA